MKNIDWELVQRQKRTLEKLLINPCNAGMADILRKQLGELWGLVELIENLQDVHETGYQSVDVH